MSATVRMLLLMHQSAIATVMLHNISPQTQWHTTVSTYTYDHNSAGHLGKYALESGSMNWQKLLCFRLSIDSGTRLKLKAANCREAGGCFSHSGSLARTRANQTMKASGKPLLSLCLLTFHQPKQITWTSPKLMGRKYHTSHHENMVRVWMSIIDEWRIDIGNSTYHVTHSQKCYWYFLLMAETFISIIFSYEIIQKQ